MRNKILYMTGLNKVIVQKYLRGYETPRKNKIKILHVIVLDVKLLGDIYIISSMTHILLLPLQKHFHSCPIH